jgi:hypothetical protein
VQTITHQSKGHTTKKNYHLHTKVPLSAIYELLNTATDTDQKTATEPYRLQFTGAHATLVAAASLLVPVNVSSG